MAKLELQIGDKTYDKAWVDDISSTSQISTDPAGINYGVIPSTGSAKLRDLGGAIRADIEAGVLPASNAQTKIRINDNQIQEHTTSDSDYDVINRELNLDFSDRLSLLDKVTYGGMPLRDYSMSAYEMLDDVLGSYGGYCREMPINWTKYVNPEAFIVAPKTTSFSVNTASGWEYIGTTIKVIPNKKYKIEYSIDVTPYKILSGYNGIVLHATSYTPKNSDMGSISYATSNAMNTAGGTNTGYFEFTPLVESVYILLNFGRAADGQQITTNINYIRVNGRSLSLATANKTYTYLPIAGATVGTVRDKLFNTNIDYPYLPSASYRETLDNFCTLTQTTLALDENGYICFFDARPIIKEDNEKIVIVPKTYQISNINRTLFSKNKVDGVDIKAKKVKDEVVIGTAIYNWDSSVDSFTATTDSKSGSNIYISLTYYSGTITVPKESGDRLERIRRLSDFDYSCTGIHSTGKAQLIPATDDAPSIAYPYYTKEKKETWKSLPLTVKNATGSESLTLQDRFSFSITQDDNNFFVNFTIPTSGERWYYQLAGVESSYAEKYKADKLEISLNGDKRVISFVEEDLSTSGIENADNPISISTSVLLQDKKQVEEIRDNIFYDYQDGIPTATIDLFCGLGNWDKGELIGVNDIARFEGEDGDWRVTGRTFKYSGAPTLSLELQKQHPLSVGMSAPYIYDAEFWYYSDGITPQYKITANIKNYNIVGLTLHVVIYDATNIARNSFSYDVAAYSTKNLELAISSVDDDSIEIDWGTCHMIAYFVGADGKISKTANADLKAHIEYLGKLQKPIINSVTWQNGDRNDYFVNIKVYNPNDVDVIAVYYSNALRKNGKEYIRANSSYTITMIADTNQDEGNLDGDVYFEAQHYETSDYAAFD